jgi:RNA polymerase sigma-70 factor, ECF subfamily
MHATPGAARLSAAPILRKKCSRDTLGRGKKCSVALSPDAHDQTLIAGANRGDAASFELLYMRYRDRVVALARRFTRDEHLAMEVAQDTFLYLLRKFPGFELRCELMTFLYPVVRHTAIAVMQRRRREIEPLSIATSKAAQPASTPLAQAMDQLPEGQAEVVRLRFVYQLPLAEIAHALGIPLGTVKSRLHLGLAALRANPDLQDFFDR